MAVCIQPSFFKTVCTEVHVKDFSLLEHGSISVVSGLESILCGDFLDGNQQKRDCSMFFHGVDASDDHSIVRGYRYDHSRISMMAYGSLDLRRCKVDKSVIGFRPGGSMRSM